MMQVKQNGILKQVPAKAGEMVRDAIFIFAGAFLQALAMRLFLVPARLASRAGTSGLSQIIHFLHRLADQLDGSLGVGFQSFSE
ncbi:MAG: YitT family protein [Anaerolineales bacterium]|nr:YitT family protein [Anaerolineales bacterium]